MLNSDFTLAQAMYECRAMRRLKADPVSDETLIQLIDAANQAASGSNAQMARWIVVKDPIQKQKL
ncbi:MAG: nitroreductase family protein, partial [Pseudomonadales bacterium]